MIIPAGRDPEAYLAGWNASAPSRIAQGLPPQLEDPVAIAEIVEILRSCPLPRDVEGEAA